MYFEEVSSWLLQYLVQDTSRFQSPEKRLKRSRRGFEQCNVREGRARFQPVVLKEAKGGVVRRHDPPTIFSAVLQHCSDNGTKCGARNNHNLYIYI